MWNNKFIVYFVFVLLQLSHAEKDLVIEKKNETVILGDMMLTPNQYQFLFTNDTFKRHGLERSFTHWPNATVPYKLDDLLKDDLKKVILEAMDYISAISCIKFQNAENSSIDYVLITTGSGCSSAVGNLRQGQQHIKLSIKCEKGNVIHELLHTLGFLHMHTSPQRDDFVKINYSNIEPTAMKNFEKYTAYVSMFNTQYDYRSIMHYRREAFGIDKHKPTIIPLEPVKAMGQRRKMSEGDVTRLNRMYKCSEFREEALDEMPKMEAIFDEVEDETAATTDVPSSQTKFPNVIPAENSRMIKMLKSVASSLMFVTRPICALSNKVQIMKSYLETM